MPRKTLAIIGAGASGLPSIRHAKFYDIDVTCFEATNDVGGLWRYKPEDTEESSVMKSTVINSSKELSAYSDFPPLPEMANFMHNREMYTYLTMYADHYDLRKYIKFNHKVLRIERSPEFKANGTWNIIFIDDKGEKKTQTFDGVLLCSGHHTLPYMPKPWEGQDKFKGDIIHSHSYKDHVGFEDKVVVVVGVGNSGGDVAVELSRIAKQVYLVTRRGTWVFNRVYDYGIPFDLVLNRRYVAAMKDFIPYWLANKAMEMKLNSRFDHARYGLQPAHHVLSAHPTVNDELPTRIASGTIKIRPNIRRFTDTGIEFVDGQTVEKVDKVVLSTGFSFEFNLVEGGELIPVVENEVDLYEYMFPMATADHNSLAIIGLIQPLGSIMPISEMQARVFMENFAGTHKLPDKAKMKESIIAKKAAMQARYVKSRRHTIQVDYITYMDELASMIGALPQFTDLLKKDPLLALKVQFGPAVPYHYRLYGPNTWEGAKGAIEGVDERVYKATSTGEYHPDHTLLYIAAAVILALILCAILV